MVMRGLGVGGAPRHAPVGPSTGGDENAPPGGSSAVASRPPLRAIQPRPAPVASSLKPHWPAPTPSRGPGARAAAARAPARRIASLAPARSLRKPAPRLGIVTTGPASSVEVPPPLKVREAISFWEENRHNVQDALSMSQQHGSDALAKIDSCSVEGSVRNTEDILSLQLELDMLKTILVEEVKARAEAGGREAALGDELKAAKSHILEAQRQKEATEKNMETVEWNLIGVIKELNELQKNNLQSPVFHKKMVMETSRLNCALDSHCRNVYIPYEDPKMQTLKCLDSEDSPLGTKLKIMQASLEKARNFNTRYQQDQEERKAYVEQKNEEVKMWELSYENLKVDVCELGKKVDIMKEEAEHQRRKQIKIEVELHNVRQQLRAVTSSGKAASFLEDGIVDLADATRYKSDMNSELSGAQEGRIFQREVALRVEQPKEPVSNEYMQKVDQSDVEMEKARSSDMDHWSENSKYEHHSACEELEQISASKQPELFGSGAHSDQSLPSCDSEQVPPPAAESVIEVLKVNELPPVAPVGPNDTSELHEGPV